MARLDLARGPARRRGSRRARRARRLQGQTRPGRGAAQVPPGTKIGE